MKKDIQMHPFKVLTRSNKEGKFLAYELFKICQDTSLVNINS